MGHKLKSSKGEIAITNYNGRIRLRWRYHLQRYSLNLPCAYLEANLPLATIKVAEIKLDMLKGQFDPSLEKYKVVPIEIPLKNAKNDIRKLKGRAQAVEVAKSANKSKLLGELINEFDHWTAYIRNIQIDNSFSYQYTKSLLKKWRDVSIHNIAENLSSQIWVPSTYNRRVRCLSTFFSWLQQKGAIANNPLQNVVMRRNFNKQKNTRREALSEEEILLFLEAIRNNTFCPKASRFKHSYYYPFLKFVFITGVRNAEAVGLRVKHANLELNTIEIGETFARTTKGTNHAARIRKGTKMGNTRFLPLNSELKDLLLPLMQSRLADDFMFLSPRGMSINDHMLEKRVLKPVMVKLGLGNKDLYAARHSFGTRAAQQGMPLTEIAYLMGHSTVDTTIKNYISVIKPAITLPRMVTEKRPPAQ